MINEHQDLIHELRELRLVLKEIRDWLVSHKKVEPTLPLDQPAQDYKCPLCNGSMKLRTARASGRQFYGCAKYPGCTGARSIDGKDTTYGPRSKPKGHNFNDEPPPVQEESNLPF